MGVKASVKFADAADTWISPNCMRAEQSDETLIKRIQRAGGALLLDQS